MLSWSSMTASYATDHSITLVKNSYSKNRADTGLNEFLKGVENFGLPSGVHNDQAVENVDIARYMLLHPERGEGCGSHLTGKSVHNQIIE